MTATATGTAANFLPLNSGDTVLIQNNSSGNPPGTTSDPYYGVFVITKTSATTFTYTIDAIGGTTPLSAGGGRQVVMQGGTTFAAPPLHAADFNRLAYNPAVTYTAPKKADGTPLTNTGTDANGNYAFNLLKWASPSVDRDPYSTYETAAGVTPMWAATVKDNLGIKVGVALYCNTDWPHAGQRAPMAPRPRSTPATRTASTRRPRGPSAASTAPSTTRRRISGAPAADAALQLPVESSSGAVGAQYFYRQLGNKVLYCDQSSPYYPRNTASIIGCNGGTPNYSGSPTKQTCNKNANACNTTPSLRNYTPAACKTDPPAMYCVPGTGGSGSNTPGTGSLPECLACTCNADMPVANGRCSVTNAVCTGNYGVLGGNTAECPDQPPTTITSCTGGNPIYAKAGINCNTVLFDPYTNANIASGMTLLQDSNANGVVCRHNNQAYTITGIPSAGGMWTYSRTNSGDVDPAEQGRRHHS